MMGQNICLKGVISKIIPKLPFTPSYLEHRYGLAICTVAVSLANSFISYTLHGLSCQLLFRQKVGLSVLSLIVELQFRQGPRYLLCAIWAFFLSCSSLIIYDLQDLRRH